MPGQQYTGSNKPFLRIIGGNIAQTVDKNTEGARLREYELKDGTKGSKWELIFMSWKGKIQGIEFKESDFGESCIVDLGDAYFTLNIASRYFQDFACKVFSADITKDIVFHPYDMEVDGKRKTGISMQQNGEKLKNYFYDGKQNLHGFPEVDKEKMTKKSYWKVYFVQTAEFLQEKLKELKFEKAPAKVESKDEPLPDLPPEEVDVDMNDLPF